MIRKAQKLLLFLALASAVFSCLPPKTIGTQGDDRYNEEISRYRRNYADSLEQITSGGQNADVTRPNPEANAPTVTASLNTQYDINESMDDFLRQVIERNTEANTYQGYTVQVYTGSSREKANEAKNTVYSLLPEADPTITFDPPNYKVKVGEFADRLEAQSIYSPLKNAFPVVLIVPERFPVVED